MKSRELSRGEKRGISKLGKEGQSIRGIAQALYNNLECPEKERKHGGKDTRHFGKGKQHQSLQDQ